MELFKFNLFIVILLMIYLAQDSFVNSPKTKPTMKKQKKNPNESNTHIEFLL